MYEFIDDYVMNVLQDFNDVTFAKNYNRLGEEQADVPTFLVDDIAKVFGSPRYDKYDVYF